MKPIKKQEPQNLLSEEKIIIWEKLYFSFSMGAAFD